MRWGGKKNSDRHLKSVRRTHPHTRGAESHCIRSQADQSILFYMVWIKSCGERLTRIIGIVTGIGVVVVQQSSNLQQ